MRVRELKVAGAFEFTPDPAPDRRGLFVAPLQDDAFVGAVGHRFPVAQVNTVVSKLDVLRGLHFTRTPGQRKYVHCVAGRALDVIVDLRVGSPTYLMSDVVEMDAESFRAVYFPIGTAHAFLALADNTVMSYLVSTPYRAELELAIDPFDPALNLPWPSDRKVIRSDRDTVAPLLADMRRDGLLPDYADCLRISRETGYAGEGKAI
ncbi:dTDP-4-dehydrorhamnose 3,5-epimerase [Amycolatopsis sp. WAC 01416]|nr:dTDP-4-dehydrorhamnose 3,5-epimerase family protein [Amycolatopsis sp. WAC 01416]RSN35592.1 dTDP-4-dehydrorhamnose 3,5-epimerase [Amycolatopsis sp. WAC 01416]